MIYTILIHQIIVHTVWATWMSTCGCIRVGIYVLVYVGVDVWVVVVRGVAFTWTRGVHEQTLLQPLVLQPGLTVGSPLPQTHGFVFELWPGTLGASARAYLGLLGFVDRSHRSRHR